MRRGWGGGRGEREEGTSESERATEKKTGACSNHSLFRFLFFDNAAAFLVFLYSRGRERERMEGGERERKERDKRERESGFFFPLKRKWFSNFSFLLWLLSPSDPSSPRRVSSFKQNL